MSVDAFNTWQREHGELVTDQVDGEEVVRRPQPTAYRVTISAIVEADSAEEAQAVTGCLLAGVESPQGHPAGPLTGVGSWAPEVKIIVEAGGPIRCADRCPVCDRQYGIAELIRTAAGWVHPMCDPDYRADYLKLVYIVGAGTLGSAIVGGRL
ncbi:MAG TPA: hypothetical protein VMZ51_08270 [Acidimicrobiales bacterium]|nr:hypothetical protein [Acidimicrobiales bacterium]